MNQYEIYKLKFNKTEQFKRIQIDYAYKCCLEIKPTETQEAMHEEDNCITYTLSNSKTPYKNTGLVSEEVFSFICLNHIVSLT